MHANFLKVWVAKTMRGKAPQRLMRFLALMMITVSMFLPEIGGAAIAFRAGSSGAISAIGITLRGVGSVASANSGSITPGLPTGLMASDLVICVVESKDNVVATLPVGWTLLNTGNNGASHQASVFWKIAAAGETAPVVTHAAGSLVVARIAAFASVDIGNPFDVTNSFTSSNSDLTTEAASITTTTANALVIFTAHMALSYGSNTVTAGGTLTQAFISAVSSGGSSASVGMYYATRSAGVQAAVTLTRSSPSTAAVSHGALIALRPAAGLIIPKPTGTVIGDVMVATVMARPVGVTFTAPSGWALVRSTSQSTGPSIKFVSYYKVAGAAEPSNYTWTLGGSLSAGAAGGILTFSGVDATTPVNVEGGNTTALGYTHTANGVTTTTANTMLVSSHGFPSASPFTPPTGMTESVDRSSLPTPDTVGVTLEMNYVAQPSAGATGNKSATASGSGSTDQGEGAAHILALKPASGVQSFSIDVGAATGSTCIAKSIAISARDSGGGVLTSYTGTLNLSTSTSKGDWSTVSANGTLTNGTADDGSASYTFVAADNGVVTLGLTHQLAQQVTITVVDSVTSSTSTTSSTISFSDNAFVFTEDLSNRISGNDVAVAGRTHDYQVSLYRRDTTLTPANCSVAASYGGSKSLKAWITRGASDPGGAAPSIGALALGNTQPGSNNLTLTFASGVAAFNLGTSDVGKYAINFRDDSTASLTAPITGSSNELTVRPFAVVISAIRSGVTDNPNANAPTGAAFTQAGENFQATVGAYKHNSAADTNDDGSPDASAALAQTTGGGSATSYAYTTTLSSTSPYTPASGILGTLSNGVLIPGSFSGGSVTQTMLTYSEVGSFTLALAVTNYLGTSGVNLSGTVFDVSGSQNAVVGRFTPYDFGVSMNTPSFTPGCATNTAFTYIGQSIVFATAPVISVTARNKAGATTRNYTGSWWKLSNASVTSRSYTAASGALDTTGLPATTIDPTIVDLGGASSGQGTLTFGVGTGLLFTRIAPVAAPFNADISLAINVIDSDDVSYGSNPVRFGTASAGNGISFTGTGGGKRMRWGRLKLSNVLGSEFVDLSMPAEAQYYNGTSFVTNTDDGCTSFASSAVLFTNFKRNLNACDTYLTVSPIALIAGKTSLSLRKPGTGNNGSVDLKPALATSDTGIACTSAVAGTANGVNLTYLRSNWDSSAPAAYDKNPTGRAVFGVPNVPKEFIFKRENY